MRWEEMTSIDFQKAVIKCKKVCLLPVACLEKHGEHLPLGTDMLWGKAVADRAADKESAIVFPSYYFGQINCARHVPGTISIRHQLLVELLENVCDEIARNGMKKIILLNTHGGNEMFLQYFAQIMLEKERDYVVYVIRLNDKSSEFDPKWKKMVETKVDGHAGEMETSQMMEAYPGLVKIKDLSPRETGLPNDRTKHLPSCFTGIWWYASYPHHYAGEGKYGSKKKGEYLLEYESGKVAEIIKAVKADTVTPKLTREFYRRSLRPSNCTS
jgi:creatinine amidohydrolase